jgi:hypothetical protein
MEVRALKESSAVGWYKVTMVTREYKAKGKALEDSFETQLEYHGSKEGAALFLLRNEKSDTWEYYFTPEAMTFSLDLVREYAWGKAYAWGQACSAPSPTLKNLSLCTGEPGDKYAYLVQPSK